MTDDIVTRLRGKEHGDNDLRCKSCDSFCCHCELCDCCLEILEVCLEAADEIERLRALLVHGLTEGYDCKGCDLCEQLKANRHRGGEKWALTLTITNQ